MTLRRPVDADMAEGGRVSDALVRVAGGLESFLRFDGADEAVTQREHWASALDRPLPEEGAGLDRVVDELRLAIRYGCRVGHPGFVGFITTGPTTSALAAVTAAWGAGPQRGLAHAFNGLEWVALRWLGELCGLPDHWEGVFTSGGSTANLLALGAARQWTFEQQGVDVAAEGMPAGAVPRVYTSTEAHRTIHRAASVLGLGRDAVHEIPVDDRQRLDVGRLQAVLAADIAAGRTPIAVVAAAGTTNTGAIDPIADVVEVARRHGVFVHVDGAYGLVAAADPEIRPMLAAVRDADSAIVDPHKWLATGVGVGATFVREPGLLARAFAEGPADYLEGSFGLPDPGAVSQFDSMNAPWADTGVELSAPSRGALVWAVLREIGISGVRDRVERHRRFARHVTERAREHPRLEALTESELSVACFRYTDGGPDLDALNRRILERLHRETTAVPSSTVVGGRLALRPCYINPRTTWDHVDELVDNVVRIGDEEAATRA